MGRCCNIHSFVDNSNFCQDRSTFVQQKLLLLDNSTLVLHMVWPFAKCNILEFCLDKIAFVNKSYFCWTKILLCYTWHEPFTKCNVFNILEFCLNKIAFVNKSMPLQTAPHISKTAVRIIEDTSRHIRVKCTLLDRETFEHVWKILGPTRLRKEVASEHRMTMNNS